MGQSAGFDMPKSCEQAVGYICLCHRLLLAAGQVFDGDGAGRQLIPA